MRLNKLVVLFTAFVTISFLVGCSEQEPDGSPVSSDRVSFSGQSVAFGLEAGQTDTRTVKIFTGNVSSEDRVFEIYVDNSAIPAAERANPSIYTVPTTVTVPANTNFGEFSVTASNNGLGGTKKFALRIKATEGLSVGTPLVFLLREVCEPGVNTVTLDITLDDWGTETTWELYNSALELIASGGPYTDGNDQKLESAQFCLAGGDYTFVIYDAYADGMCCAAGNGGYKLNLVTADGITVLGSGGTFGEFETVEFTLP